MRVGVLAASLAWCVALGAAPGVLRAEEPPGNPRLERLADGRYKLGAVVLDQDAREVRFAVAINQESGPVEYLLVGRGGKTHESVLRTEAEPMHVQTAMLLLGVAGAAGKTPGVAPPPAAIDNQYLATAPLPAGKPVTLLLRWKDAAGAAVERRAESLLEDAHRHAPAAEGAWLYNGSFFAEGRFEADNEKSFVALVTDPAALINNPRPGHEDDTTWVVAGAHLPPAATPLDFVIQLPPAAPAQP